MKKQVLALTLAAGFGSVSTAHAAGSADNCGKYATKFAVDAVTSKILVDGGNLWDKVIYPQAFGQAPEVTGKKPSSGEITYEVVVGVSDRNQEVENASITRYYVKVSVIDHDTACALTEDGINIDTDIELEN